MEELRGQQIKLIHTVFIQNFMKVRTLFHKASLSLLQSFQNVCNFNCQSYFEINLFLKISHQLLFLT